jgi:hypothetical protein
MKRKESIGRQLRSAKLNTEAQQRTIDAQADKIRFLESRAAEHAKQTARDAQMIDRLIEHLATIAHAAVAPPPNVAPGVPYAPYDPNSSGSPPLGTYWPR